MTDPRRQVISDVLIGGNHLASALWRLGCDPSIQEDYRMVLARFGQPAGDMWIAWRAIMNLAEYDRLEQEHGRSGQTNI